jgi:hypothetical protein
MRIRINLEEELGDILVKDEIRKQNRIEDYRRRHGENVDLAPAAYHGPSPQEHNLKHIDSI